MHDLFPAYHHGLIINCILHVLQEMRLTSMPGMHCGRKDGIINMGQDMALDISSMYMKVTFLLLIAIYIYCQKMKKGMNFSCQGPLGVDGLYQHLLTTKG